MNAVETVVHDACLTEIFNDIGQKKDVEIQIEVMILLHVFNVEFSPHFLSSLVLFRRYSRHVISGVQIVLVSDNVFGLFYEFSKCPVGELGLFSFFVDLVFVSIVGSELGPFLYVSFKLDVLEYGPM